eukprot:9474717-Pyramimonas_sp.AAC.1
MLTARAIIAIYVRVSRSFTSGRRGPRQGWSTGQAGPEWRRVGGPPPRGLANTESYTPRNTPQRKAPSCYTLVFV